jgi:SAM-dependent methyltransferase
LRKDFEMADTAASRRFSGFADLYDAARPTPPTELVELLTAWCGVERPDVVDLGAGTGLSTVLWSGRAASVVAVEPSADMRVVTEQRVAGRPGFRVVDATAEATGLPSGSADLVTASQALHWFDADRALPEIARLLRPGGVFAAYDSQWPPTIDPEVDRAYAEFDELLRAEEIRRGLRPAYAAKQEHPARLRASGLFRHVVDIAVHKRDDGDAARLVDVARSQGGTVALLAAGVAESDIGLAHLRAVAAERIPTTRTWWWTYRVRLAVR